MVDMLGTSFSAGSMSTTSLPERKQPLSDWQLGASDGRWPKRYRAKPFNFTCMYSFHLSFKKPIWFFNGNQTHSDVAASSQTSSTMP
jgi:hypothetical protein